MERDNIPDAGATIRAMTLHGVSELLRVRAELDSVSRLFRRSHVLAGSTPELYRDGDLFASLVLAATAVDDAACQVARFLDLQVAVVRDPKDILRQMDDERAVPCRYPEEESAEE